MTEIPQIEFSSSDFKAAINRLADLIKRSGNFPAALYGVPRGGVPVVIALQEALKGATAHTVPIITKKELNEYSPEIVMVVDDLVDSGKTIEPYMLAGHGTATLHVKETTPPQYLPDFFDKKMDGWVTYWWEESAEKDMESHLIRILERIGEDPTREGLVETPKRIIKSWNELYAGYQQDPKDFLKTFDAGSYNEMVVLRDIELYSMCEHHNLPFLGKAHIAYIPDGKVIGVSKLARILDCFARRMQIQERIGDQVTEILMKELNAKGAACIIEAQHLCMRMRGVSKQNSTMVTSSLKGTFIDGTTQGLAARNELMTLIHR